MKISLSKKIIAIGILLISLSLTACYRDHHKDRMRLPEGSVGGISFQGKGEGIKVFNKSGELVESTTKYKEGKAIAEATTKYKEGKTIAEATIKIKKINPCVVDWCPSDSPCEIHIYEELEQCPAWW